MVLIYAGVSVVSLDKSLEVNHISARVGDNVEIKCDVTGTPPPPLVWRRYGTDVETLSEPEVFHSNEIIRSLSFVVSLVNTIILSIHQTTISINVQIYIYISSLFLFIIFILLRKIYFLLYFIKFLRMGIEDKDFLSLF